MSPDRAVVANRPGEAKLHHFNDEIVAKMELDGGGFWILIGTAQIVSRDRDDQDASAKLFHDRNVLIHKETNRLLCNQEQDFYVQAGFVAKDRETVTLECNTYDGECRNGSVIAIKVDDIEFQ